MNAHSTAKCVRTKNNYTKKRDMKPMFKLATTAVLATAIGLAPVTRAEANNHNNDALGALVVGGLLALALADAARRAEAEGTPVPDPGHGAPNSDPSQFQLVIGIQTALNYFDFSAGAVDGIPGRGTRGAIQRYQAAMGYPVGNGSLRQHQFEFLMEAYNWAITGGAAQTGLAGVALLIAYRDGPSGQPQPPVIDPPVVDLPVAYSFTGTWQTGRGKLNLVQYIVGNQRYVVGDFAGQGVIAGRVTGNCASGIFTDDTAQRYGAFRFRFEGNELDGEWRWPDSFVTNAWDGSYDGEQITSMQNFSSAGSFPITTGRGVNPQSGLWAINNMAYGQMHSMVASNIWVGDLNPGGVMVALSNDGRTYHGVMTDEGRPSDVSFTLEGGQTGRRANGTYGPITGRSLGFNMTQVRDRDIRDGGPRLGSDLLPCN
jgi:peptidoglycan hydrolase-like protein with peptidoglycan-binding domain